MCPSSGEALFLDFRDVVIGGASGGGAVVVVARTEAMGRNMYTKCRI